ncbi:MAG: iron-sulfur cluster assembly accessory protein [Propionibacteriaceae bacterium]|jgi:iron-sulfur cluster assembly accessory protein|nr:iron-sulfur cluster assembly accessory protein [Propionibacteriaceae bacterium]
MTETLTHQGVLLSDAAAAKVASLLAQEESELALRVAVQAGGCAGLQYQLFFDDERYPGDIVDHFGDVTVVVDAKSAPYLVGATIDFADTIERQGFTIDNPNATGSCACGGSFH